MAEKKTTEPVPGMASVIIRARDEMHFIGPLLEELHAQSYRPMEVIVVDSGSADGTLEIAARLADRVLTMPPEEFSFGRSLNLGCTAARGEFLVFASAHTLPHSNNWLANLISPFSDLRVAMVYGRQLPHATTRLDEERDFEANFGPHSHVLMENPVGPNNANSAVRASVWRNLPFDESLPGMEDIDWARRAQRRGLTVHYAGNAALVHIHQESLRQIFRRFRREGEAFARMFPESRVGATGALRRWIASCLRDAEYALRRRQLRRLPPVPAARAAEFAGLWLGYHDEARRRARSAREVVDREEPQRAVRIEGPGRHYLVEEPSSSPGPEEVSVRIAYVGVCRTDLDVLDATLDYYRMGRARFPIVPGHEYSGIVESTGKEVRGLAPGDRVVGECVLGCGACEACRRERPADCERRVETGVMNKDGAYATRLLLPASAVHRVPDEVSLRQAALAEPTAVVVKAARLLNVGAGERACVVGAGPIGQLAAQVLRARGARVTLIDRDPERLRHAAELDISTASGLDGPELCEADIVIEATGNPGVIAPLIQGAALKARICLLGLPHQPLSELAPGAPPNGRRVFGSIGSDPMDWPVALELMARGELELDTLTASVEPLEHYELAWERCRAGEGIKQLLLVEPRLGSL